MRKLLFAVAAVFAIGMSDVAYSQKSDVTPSAPPAAECHRIDAVRALMAARGEQERAYLEGDRARPLLAGTQAPPAAVAAAVFGSDSEAAVLVVLFNASGCAMAAGEFPPSTIARFLGSA